MHLQQSIWNTQIYSLKAWYDLISVSSPGVASMKGMLPIVMKDIVSE